METTCKFQEQQLRETSETSFSQQPTDAVETKPLRPPSRNGEVATGKSQKPSQFFYQADAAQRQTAKFEHPALLVTHTPVKHSVLTENNYNRIINPMGLRQHSPKHLSVVTLSPPSKLQSGASKLYHPVSATTTIHQPITVLPHAVSSVIRNPTVVQVSPVVEVSRVRRECCEHERTQMQRLQTMNDFLTENYARVYGKFKELEREKASFIKPMPVAVRCIDQATLLRQTREKIDLLYEDELQSAITKLRNMSTVLPQFKRPVRASQ